MSRESAQRGRCGPPVSLCHHGPDGVLALTAWWHDEVDGVLGPTIENHLICCLEIDIGSLSDQLVPKCKGSSRLSRILWAILTCLINDGARLLHGSDV
jgi:hypothetical protein